MMPNRSLKLKQGCRWHTLACHTVVTMQVHILHVISYIAIEGLKLTEEKGRRKKNS